jgi:multiple sugar transport system permease protein
MAAAQAIDSGALALARQERKFAWYLLGPSLLLLLITTTAPLVYLGWTSFFRLDMTMPWLSGFAGLDNYGKMLGDPRFMNSLWLTVVYTSSTVCLQILVGLSLAMLVQQIPKGQAMLRIAAILPIVLAPVVVGLFWRTLVLAPDVGLVDLVTRALGLGSQNWLGDPQLALISVICSDGRRTRLLNRNLESIRLSNLVYRIKSRLRLKSCDGAARPHTRRVLRHV